MNQRDGYRQYPTNQQPFWPGQGFNQLFPSWMQGIPGFPGQQGSQWFPSTPGFPAQPNFPNQPGFPGQSGPGGQAAAPSSPPPSYTPSYPEFQTFAVDPGAISGCLFRFTYVWTSRFNGFWFYPTFVGRNSVAGFQWNSRRNRWEYLGIDLQRIDAFRCF
ncbi:hypothetical protein [Sporosarcina sp.]|uniref:hypothetical protein n=1 Tax=Sporosarcina sp. TaxID=49982 RepID=UPI0026302B73|nr:hypothetical protein [Sporosarcina sp.]